MLELTWLSYTTDLCFVCCHPFPSHPPRPYCRLKQEKTKGKDRDKGQENKDKMKSKKDARPVKKL